MTTLQHSDRRPLPHRRHSWTQKAKVGNQTVYLCCGEYEDGTLGEVFLDASKAGSSIRAVLSSLAIFLSLGLQHGVPLTLYVEALRGLNFEPSGDVSGSAHVMRADSILDWVVRELEAHYLKETT